MSRIGLIDVDGHGKKKQFGATIYPNIAIAKIAAYHKAIGDEVFWYDGIFSGHCDKVYMSKVFNFSPDYDDVIDADEVVKGGTGYDIKSCLPQEIDDMQPDLSIYPNVPQDTSTDSLREDALTNANGVWFLAKRGLFIRIGM